jgi:hypothetical protein
MKLFQFDENNWGGGAIDRTWKFGTIKKRALFGVGLTTTPRIFHSAGGLHILLSFFTECCPFGIDIQHDKFELGFYFFAEYSTGWEDEDNG